MRENVTCVLHRYGKYIKLRHANHSEWQQLNLQNKKPSFFPEYVNIVNSCTNSTHSKEEKKLDKYQYIHYAKPISHSPKSDSTRAKVPLEKRLSTK